MEFQQLSALFIRVDQRYGAALRSLRTSGSSGLLTSDGIDFIKNYICGNTFLTRLLAPEDEKWQLVVIEVLHERPDAVFYFFGSDISMRTCLILAENTEVVFYPGTEFIQGQTDNFGLCEIAKEKLKQCEDSIAAVTVPMRKGGFVAYEGQMAIEIRKGSLALFAFGPTEATTHFNKLKLGDRLKEKVAQLKSDHVAFSFTYVASFDEMDT